MATQPGDLSLYFIECLQQPGLTRAQEVQIASRPPDQKLYSNRGLRLLRLARGGHREVTDFLGTR